MYQNQLPNHPSTGKKKILINICNNISYAEISKEYITEALHFDYSTFKVEYQISTNHIKFTRSKVENFQSIV